MKITAFSFGIVMLIEAGGYFLYDSNYYRAQAITIKKYGDREAPLTEQEKDRWFSDMGVRKDRNPSFSQLRRFVNENNPDSR